MCGECYIKSCLCAPLRWICCYKPKSPKQTSVVAQVAIPVITTHTVQSHHRERTWKLSNGRMSYEVPH